MSSSESLSGPDRSAGQGNYLAGLGSGEGVMSDDSRGIAEQVEQVRENPAVVPAAVPNVPRSEQQSSSISSSSSGLTTSGMANATAGATAAQNTFRLDERIFQSPILFGRGAGKLVWSAVTQRSRLAGAKATGKPFPIQIQSGQRVALLEISEFEGRRSAETIRSHDGKVIVSEGEELTWDHFHQFRKEGIQMLNMFGELSSGERSLIGLSLGVAVDAGGHVGQVGEPLTEELLWAIKEAGGMTLPVVGFKQVAVLQEQATTKAGELRQDAEVFRRLAEVDPEEAKRFFPKVYAALAEGVGAGEGDVTHLVCKLANRGSALSALVDGRPIVVDHHWHRTCLGLLCQVGDALLFMHNRAGIAHADIAARNILIHSSSEKGDRAMLTDFGLSDRMGTPYATTNTLPLFSSAPEVVAGAFPGRPKPQSGHTHHTDAFQYGAALLEVLLGKPPYSNVVRNGRLSNAEMVAIRLRNGHAFPIEMLRKDSQLFEDDYIALQTIYPGLGDLVERLLMDDPQARSTIEAELPELRLILEKLGGAIPLSYYDAPIEVSHSPTGSEATTMSTGSGLSSVSVSTDDESAVEWLQGSAEMGNYVAGGLTTYIRGEVVDEDEMSGVEPAEQGNYFSGPGYGSDDEK